MRMNPYELCRIVHKAGILPVSAGGDHVITYPIFKAIAADRPIGMIHIDVHPDTWGGAQRLLYGLRGLNLIGGDVVEVAPPYDQTGNTALVGASMMFEILCLVADSTFGVGKTTRR
jgi:arginase family enzyme